MRARTLTYADAVRLLGEAESPAVAAVGRLAGVAAGAVTAASVGTVDFFALRDELVRWGHSAVGGLRERTLGLGRFDRTQRLVAAHSVIAITAFYEALDETLAGHPRLDLESAELTAAEQVALATAGPAAQKYAQLVQALIDTPPPMPAPSRPYEQVLDDLAGYYRNLADLLEDFLLGLHAFEHREYEVSGPLRDVMLIDTALTRYQEAFRALSTQAAEFGVWRQMIDAQATREALRQAVAELKSELAGVRAAMTDQAAVAAVRRGLGTRHRAQLDRAVLAASHVPEHIRLPSLRRGYVNPRGRVAIAGPADRPATEAWWEERAHVDDVPDFLLAHLTSAEAVLTPLVVLGQPGSGKSVLTKVLAAALPESDFLVIRVELRNVPVDTSIQAQVEGALYQLLGERVSWPEVFRGAGSALPVVILDGFDELLQVTGMNRADYLEQVRLFQQREEELGRPVAVLVTSRTVVADRARFPEGTVVVRLAPFDESQVRQWLAVWNTTNEASLRSRTLKPLPAEVALAHDELATQPLLLLLLALYDAGANALQDAGGGLGRVELYERLFADFIAREVDKRRTGQTDEQWRDETDLEWRRLSAVALATLNRSGEVILEAELDRDLPHLLGTGDLDATATGSAHRTLTVSQLLVGRFFFIHEAKATRDTGAPERSFEFLHATFGDFLAARLIVAALLDLADERIHQLRRPKPGVLDVGFLFAATSFVTITRRAPLWEFCRGMLAKLTPEQRRSCRDLVLSLLPEAGYLHPTWSLADYQPRWKPYAARHAAFSANLVCFAVLLTDGPVDTVELVGEPVVTNWRQLALLWNSQLDPEDRQRMWQAIRVAWRLDTEPNRLEVRIEDGSEVGVFESLPWPPDVRPADNRDDPLLADVTVPSESRIGRSLRRSAFVQTAHEVRELLYDLMPAWRMVRREDWVVELGMDGLPLSSAGVLLQLLTVPVATQEHQAREKLYDFALGFAQDRGYRHLVLRQLADDAPQLREETLVNLSTLFDRSDLRYEFDQLARIVAASAANKNVRPASALRIFARLRELAEAGVSRWPPGARKQIARAFAGVGLPVPPEVARALKAAGSGEGGRG